MNRYSSRGRNQHNKVDAQKRTICVSVRLSAEEADLLDTRRKTMQRGTYLRSCLLDKLPPIIHPLNIKTASDLGRAIGNLATVATSMRAGKYIGDSEILTLIKDLRLLLVTGSASLISYYHSDSNEEAEE
ncbi:MAG TPA: hypothetical protein DE312_07500 [Gallionella sp.]|nr:MAG: hypothetical protein A2Z87_00305 [Gallionellales bacterium GWA2_54_124]OGT17921.1 MAG: hypothetical protein A2522_08615 [Gallionellales bacterium RIFOXYD12_FULL_53_10]HCI53140.1 hypothetical protein [Gallionella sp.]